MLDEITAGGATLPEALYSLDEKKMTQADFGGKVERKNDEIETIFHASPELEKHIREVDISVPRKRGIGGAHNSTAFFENDIKIVDEIPSEIRGVKIVYYKMPKLNPDGSLSGEYGATVFIKTIYDPKIISDWEFINRGLEAANYAKSNSMSSSMPRVWTGIDSQGITWKGYFADGRIISFFPIE